jgi:NADH-quinone oxidoreductase subunit L
MWAPLVILAVPAFFIGLVNVNGGFGDLIEGALPAAIREGHAGTESVVLVASTLAALLGIGAAAAIYYKEMPASEMIRSRLGPLPAIVENKYYMDVLAEDIIVRRVLYGGIARGAQMFDTYVVDMAVNTAARVTRIAGDISRRTTAGQQQAYSSLLLAGVVVAVVVIFVLSGNALER